MREASEMKSLKLRRNRATRVAPSACLSPHRPALDVMLPPKRTKCAESRPQVFGIAIAFSTVERDARTNASSQHRDTGIRRIFASGRRNQAQNIAGQPRQRRARRLSEVG